MLFDYMKEVFNIENKKTEQYFFTYKIDGGKFFICDVYVKPEFRGTIFVVELYNLIEETWLKSNCETMNSMVQRCDPHFKNALKLNLRYKMKIIREDQETGKIYLRRERNETL